MVKKQQLAVGGLSSLFNSSSSNKQENTSPALDAVLPCRHSSSSSSSYSAWQWTSCGLHPRTLSFRQLQEEEDSSRHGCQHSDDDSQQQACYKGMDSVDIFSTVSEAEAVLRAVRSDRLLFQPEEASSIKAAASKANNDDDDKAAGAAAFGGAMAMSMESENPYRDFRESMEAMVMSQGGGAPKDWCWLEEMLGWYLRANGKTTHGLIVGAFVDLLVELSTAASPASDSDSSSSPITPATAAANCCYSASDCSCSFSSSL